MTKLLGLNLMRLRRDKLFYVGMAVMLVYTLICLISPLSSPYKTELDRLFFGFVLAVPFLAAAFCSLFVGAEYSDGVIRNKLIVGHARASAYLANLLTCMLATLAFCALSVVMMCAVGIPLYGFFRMSVTRALLILAASLLCALAFSSLYAMVAMLCHNKAIVAVGCLLGLVVTLLGSALCYSRLQEPPTYSGYSYTYTENDEEIGGGVRLWDGEASEGKEMEVWPNPNYLDGPARDVTIFFGDALPTGQVLLVMNHAVERPVRMILCSLGVIALSTGAGLYGFRRKDIL